MYLRTVQHAPVGEKKYRYTQVLKCSSRRETVFTGVLRVAEPLGVSQLATRGLSKEAKHLCFLKRVGGRKERTSLSLSFFAMTGGERGRSASQRIPYSYISSEIPPP